MGNRRSSTRSRRRSSTTSSNRGQQQFGANSILINTTTLVIPEWFLVLHIGTQGIIFFDRQILIIVPHQGGIAIPFRLFFIPGGNNTGELCPSQVCVLFELLLMLMLLLLCPI